ncbi:YfbR-like 5'-deoxynucleotidase, partial [Salmonella enterica]|uniref:YfbR-like 5'-deoxynucleotidase n=1 Tax=Salmonella enterica TaxID=28901 RepID=UPI00398C63E0
MRNVLKGNISERIVQVAMVLHALAALNMRKCGCQLNAVRIAMLAVYHDASEVLTGDLKAFVVGKTSLNAGWVHSGISAPLSLHNLHLSIGATTQLYPDFAPQVEAVAGARLRDAAFFNQTVEGVQGSM